MTALGFQTVGRHQTSPASLRGTQRKRASERNKPDCSPEAAAPSGGSDADSSLASSGRTLFSTSRKFWLMSCVPATFAVSKGMQFHWVKVKVNNNNNNEVLIKREPLVLPELGALRERERNRLEQYTSNKLIHTWTVHQQIQPTAHTHTHTHTPQQVKWDDL